MAQISSHDQVPAEERGQKYELEQYCDSDDLIKFRCDLDSANECIQKALPGEPNIEGLTKADMRQLAADVSWQIGVNLHFTAFDQETQSSALGERAAYEVLQKGIELMPTQVEGYRWCFFAMAGADGGRLPSVQSYMEAKIEKKPSRCRAALWFSLHPVP